MSISTDVHEEMVQKIGDTSGQVWGHLATDGPMTLAKLIKLTGKKRDDILLALGWLARENKLYFFEQGRNKMIGLIEDWPAR